MRPLNTIASKNKVAKMAGKIPGNSDAKLATRHKQSAIVGRLLVACFVAMRSGYPRKHLGAVFEELLVAMMIRVSSGRFPPNSEKTLENFGMNQVKRNDTTAVAMQARMTG